MCPPDFYGIEYEINPWMSRSRGADRLQSMAQWAALRHLLEALGARISLLEAVPGLPDMVFTANAGLVFGRQFVSARFRHAVRAGESPHFVRWFEQQGFAVHRLPEPFYFEGAGDALFCGDTLFCGYRIRSDARSHQHVAKLIGREVLPLELVDERFYHLDTCFCPLSATQAIWYPAAFDRYAQQVVRQNIADLIDVVPDEACRFACNAVVVGRAVITPSGCPTLHLELQRRGFEPHFLELDEFLKAGGSAKCLTIRVRPA
jgi:N-dimethylarginine dimethylaminohydrolase